MRTKLFCAALLLANAGASACATACDDAAGGCYCEGGCDYGDCGGMQACDGAICDGAICDGAMGGCEDDGEWCDGEIEDCEGDMQSCDGGMQPCDDGCFDCDDSMPDGDIQESDDPFGDDSCSIMDGCCGNCGPGTGTQSSGCNSSGSGQCGGANLPASGDGTSQNNLPVVRLTREQAEAVRYSGYFITGVRLGPTGEVEFIEVSTYRGVDAAGGRRFGVNPFTSGRGDDTLQVRVDPNNANDARLTNFQNAGNGWIRIPPTHVFNDPTVRAAQREVLYRAVRNLGQKLNDADRGCQRNQDGYYAATNQADRNNFATAYWKAKKERDRLQGQLEAKQLQLALSQETGAGGP